jgi:hypothetical protein
MAAIAVAVASLAEQTALAGDAEVFALRRIASRRDLLGDWHHAAYLLELVAAALRAAVMMVIGVGKNGKDKNADER